VLCRSGNHEYQKQSDIWGDMNLDCFVLWVADADRVRHVRLLQLHSQPITHGGDGHILQ
jgi:hypothetical protein